jgi:hypothetical protein
LAGIGIGIYQNVDDATTKAVRLVRTHHPDQEWQALLDNRYGQFLRLAAAARDAAADL